MLADSDSHRKGRKGDAFLVEPRVVLGDDLELAIEGEGKERPVRTCV